ncbi:hypothetical protein [Cytobacillus dafuensis]|uniref:Uncharacterized protein n=1 Tax=Cytobacillus dafuensis TaxID=1742359 RepID=A0A5B8ZCS6_CYTDA|nr:hypothetical protein [Cytobacillus dafuensis]QED49316.1 hypothetical protein FSZ17_19760 [Cytobacillus dafuensis]
MSLYRFLASDNPVYEVDHSGFIQMKVKDIKEMIPIPNPPFSYSSWDELDEDMDVLYAKNEEDLGGLQIALCDNPPYGLESYINSKYIYWLEGNFSSKFLNQLTEYLKTNIQKGETVELWSIWFGDEVKSKKVMKVSFETLSNTDLEILRNHECCCVIIERN